MSVSRYGMEDAPVLSKVGNGSKRVFMVGGYMGTGVSGDESDNGSKLYDWVDRTLRAVFGVVKEGVIDIQNGADIAYLRQAINYSPPGGTAWYIVVNVDKIGLSEAKSLMRLAGAYQGTEGYSAVWLFLIRYSRGRKGFPAYKSLLGSKEAQGLAEGIWCTYMRRREIFWLLSKAYHDHLKALRADKKAIEVDLETGRYNSGGQALLEWVSANYNRDISSIMDLYGRILQSGLSGFDLDDGSGKSKKGLSLNRGKRAVIAMIGNPTSSAEGWVLSVVKNKNKTSIKENIEQAQRLYAASRSNLYVIAMSTLNGLIEVKMKLLSGDGFHGKFETRWINSDSSRYAKFYRELQPSQGRWGGDLGIPLESLLNARSLLMKARDWRSELSVFEWVYAVKAANQGEDVSHIPINELYGRKKKKAPVK